VGDNVGYTIRLDSKGGPGSSLMFCTNGVLLRMLTGGGSGRENPLSNVTHLVVDEIHERDRFADFLLILVGGRLDAGCQWLPGWDGLPADCLSG
jgi:HrpA-like RNA helicase